MHLVFKDATQQNLKQGIPLHTASTSSRTSTTICDSFDFVSDHSR